MNQQSGYVKDNWRLGDRLTLNLGLRLERYHVFLPAQSKPAGVFSQAASFPSTDILTWNGIAPRASFSYALTADAKTAIKATYGRFNWLQAADYARTYNRNDIISTTYRWNDPNNNGTYDPGELGGVRQRHWCFQ
jgi:outer membrane receptor protein involved in Fe transport